MSDDWIIVIPADPWLKVAPERLETARTWLANKGSDRSKTQSHTFDKPQFFDAGANFSKAKCPACGNIISMEAWGYWMDEDAEAGGFRLKPKQLECCGGPAVNLNELKYEHHQAFGLCAIKGMNLDIGSLSNADINFLESLINASVSIVFQHI